MRGFGDSLITLQDVGMVLWSVCLWKGLYQAIAVLGLGQITRMSGVGLSMMLLDLGVCGMNDVASADLTTLAGAVVGFSRALAQ
jgi:hypothetical protein